jgi:hypothetical protein
MTDKLPFTIEILEFEDGRPVVRDRVIGGSVYLEEAKRIGQHLLSLVDAGTRTHGYRVLNHDHELVYDWQPDDDDEASSKRLDNDDARPRRDGDEATEDRPQVASGVAAPRGA